jgi:hypothetical protein
MKLVSKFSGLGIWLLVVYLLWGCGVETNRDRALHAKRSAEVRRLLVAMELYAGRNGGLPTTLEALCKSDIQVRDIGIARYIYSPNGIVVADGSRWLVAVSDPLHTNQIIVGKLPVDIAVRTPREK